LYSKPVNIGAPGYKDNSHVDLSYLDSEQGMKLGIVRSVFEDSKGNIWINTGGSGVGKYDGETITYFDKPEGLPSSYAWNAIEDNDNNNIWFHLPLK
jgi:ligand-binding sensor domain-containing protein